MKELPVLTKPKFAEPCNNCGECCRLEQCEISEIFLPERLPCAALEFENGRFVCGMVKRPSYHLGLNFNADETLVPLVKEILAIGQGCGMPDEEPEIFHDPNQLQLF